MPLATVSLDSHENCGRTTEQNPGPIGPFQNGSDRYMILSDDPLALTGGNLRAFKSSDAAHTVWTEMDAANAPVQPSNAGSPLPRVYEAFGVVRDPTLPVLYAVYWGTDFNIRLSRFDMSTDTWGAAVPSTLTYLSGSLDISPVDNFLICMAHRASDNSLWIAFKSGVPGNPGGITRVYGAKILLSTDTWDAALTLLGTADVASVEAWGCTGMQYNASTGDIHCIYTQDLFIVDVGFNQSSILHQVIRSNDTLGPTSTVVQVGPGVAILRPYSVSYLSISSTGRLMFTYQFAPSVGGEVWVTRSQAAETPVWTSEMPPALQGTNTVNTKGTLTISGVDYIFYVALTVGPGWTFFYITSTGIGQPWSAAGTEIVVDTSDPQAEGGVTAALFSSGFAITSIIGVATPVLGQAYFEQAIAPPVSTTLNANKGGGGTLFPRYLNRTLLSASLARTATAAPISSWFLPPNEFDRCLAKEFRRYNCIDRTLLGCGNRAACTVFQDEREWHEPPAGAVTFNPDGVIALPAPDDGDVVIFSFRVPLGFDGIITAQYHGYTQAFSEGGGDLVWRIRAAGRYLRDTAQMLSSIGSLQDLSPCPGGLWVRSGNLVEYLVSAPNTSGLLPPAGQGNIVAGLHGWFFPRK